MTAGSPMRVHHVVFCLQPENLERASALWTEWGLAFHELDLDDLGVRVLIDWQSGIELLAPRPDAGPEAAAFVTFLDERGEGVYSVVMGVSEVDGPAAVASRYGVPAAYEQRRDHGGLHLEEIMLAPFHGMPVTLLSTDPPL